MAEKTVCDLSGNEIPPERAAFLSVPIGWLEPPQQFALLHEYGRGDNSYDDIGKELFNGDAQWDVNLELDVDAQWVIQQILEGAAERAAEADGDGNE